VHDHSISERSAAKETSIYDSDQEYRHLRQISVKDSEKNKVLTRKIITQSCLHPDYPTAKLSLSVTELSEYMVCPKRYYYRYSMGLEEGIVEKASSSNDSPAWSKRQQKSMMSSLERGNAAHFILKHINFTNDLAQKRLEIDELLMRQGLPSSGSEMEVFKENIMAFLKNDVGRVLSHCGEGVVLREMPFHMRLHDQPGSFTVLMQGTLDLVYQDPQGKWHVVDYKYSSGREIDKERYKMQLMIYALAVMKQIKADRIQLTISVLEDRDSPLTRWHVTRDEVDTFGEQIVHCACEIARMQGEIPTEPQVLSAVNDCHRRDCAYQTRCLD
jgi:ATP-dependent exoDNAse (exonuclease V) beta subunit